MTPSSERPIASSVFAAVATAASLVAVGAVALAGAAPSAVVLAVAACFVPYAWLVRGAWAGTAPGPWWLGLAIAAVVGIPMVVAPTPLSDDLFRYLWDARVLHHGLDPYARAPDDPALAPLRDALHGRINHPSIPTIYPPVAQALFWLADRIAHAPWSVKGLALAAHLGTAAIVHRMAGDQLPAAAWVHALNPLAIEEAALGGHVDAVAALGVAGFGLAMVRRKHAVAALLAGLTSGVKLVGIALAPLLRMGSRRLALVAFGLALLPLIPVASAGSSSDVPSGFVHYSRRWQGNAGAFVVLEGASQAAVAGLGRLAGAPEGHVRLEPLRPLLEWAEGTPLDPRAGVLGEKKGRGDIVDFEARYVGGLLARALAAAAVLGLALLLARRRVEPVLAARWVVLALLLLAPQVHPWYLLWLLPLEVAAGRVTGLVWSAAVLVAYAPLDGWLANRRWVESPLAALLEYGLVALVLALEELPRLRRASRWRFRRA